MKKLIVIFILLPFFLKAQTPGYLGKKFSIGYEGIMGHSGLGAIKMLFFDFTRSAYTTNGKLRPFLAPVFKHGINIEYVLGKRFAMQGGIQYQQFGSKDFDVKFYDYSSYNYSEPITLQSDSFFKTSNLTYRLGFIFSRGSYILPHGKYFGLDVNYIKSNSERLANEVVTERFREDYVGLSIDFGNRRIIYDKIILEGGIGLGLNFRISNAIDDISKGKVSIEEFTAADHIFSTNLFRVKFGIRYLL
jgi:hypothetical protein